MKKRWLVAVLLIGVGLALATPVPDKVSAWLSRDRDEQGTTGGCSANAPSANLNFTLKDASGKDVNLAAFRGKVVLLNFWATWCPPCKLEIPWFVEFQERYQNEGLQVVGVSVDDPPSALPPFAKQYRVNYPLLVGQEREDIQTAYGPIFGIPITVIIGRNGKVCKKHIGPVGKEQFESEIKALL